VQVAVLLDNLEFWFQFYSQKNFTGKYFLISLGEGNECLEHKENIYGFAPNILTIVTYIKIITGSM